MEESIHRSQRRNCTQEDQILFQVLLKPHLVYNDLPPKVLKTVKSALQDGAPRPVNPLIVLENRVQEIFYQDVHALLPPPGVPPLPSSSGNFRIDDPRDLNSSGNLAERQQRHQFYVPPSLNQTTSFRTIVPPFGLLPPITFQSIKFSRETTSGTEEIRPKLPQTPPQTFKNKKAMTWSLPPP